MSIKQKYFGIGLSRTGSKSLAIAMSMLGFTVKHNPKFDEIPNYEFTCDLVVATRFRFLDHYYPDAKWILTVRNVDEWVKSCRHHIRRGRKHINGELDISLRRAEHRWNAFGRFDFDASAYRLAYNSFVSDIMDYFLCQNPGKLLIMDICAGDGWEKLCPFVMRSIPLNPFPHRHARMKKTIV